MKKLLLMALISSAQAQGFNGTIYDLNSGRTQIINGSIDGVQPRETYLQALRRINAELAESNARLSAEIAASQQLYQLREQTRLLREIANK